MRATRRFHGNRHRAGRTIFGNRRLLGRLLHLVDPAHEQKHRESDDREINYQRDEVAVVPGDRAPLPRVCGCGESFTARRFAQHDELVREIEPTGEQADRRHDDVFDERADDRAKGRADNHAHREINRVTFDRKFFEFLPHVLQTFHTTTLTSFWGITITLRTVLPAINALILGLARAAAFKSASVAWIDNRIRSRTLPFTCTTISTSSSTSNRSSYLGQN